MQLEKQSITTLSEALELSESGFSGLPPVTHEYDSEKLKEVLCAVADRMKDNYPYFHPFYAGQMLKPPHPAASIAYFAAMLQNPNNHALDGGPETSAMEKKP